MTVFKSTSSPYATAKLQQATITPLVDYTFHGVRNTDFLMITDAFMRETNHLLSGVSRPAWFVSSPPLTLLSIWRPATWPLVDFPARHFPSRVAIFNQVQYKWNKHLSCFLRSKQQQDFRGHKFSFGQTQHGNQSKFSSFPWATKDISPASCFIVRS